MTILKNTPHYDDDGYQGIRTLKRFATDLIASAFYEAEALLRLLEKPAHSHKTESYLERLEECHEFFYLPDGGAADVIESFELALNLDDLKAKIDDLIDGKVQLRARPKSATIFDVIEDAKAPAYPKKLRDEIKRESSKQKFAGQLEFYFLQRLESTPRTVRPKLPRTHTLRVFEAEQTQLWEVA